MRESGQEVRARFPAPQWISGAPKKSPPVNQKDHCFVPADTTKGGDPTKGLPRYVDINNDSRVQCAVELQLLWWMAGGGTARSERRTERAGMVCVKRGFVSGSAVG